MVHSNACGIRVVNFRAACASLARETALRAQLASLRRVAVETDDVHVLWPADRDLATAARILGCPPAHAVVAAVGAAAQPGPRGAIVIHTRNGAMADFLALSPLPVIRFVFHLNGEEAAMRWERNDAAPRRRIQVAVRLQQAGWQVSLVVGPLRHHSNCRDDYAEVLSALPESLLDGVSLSLPGDDLIECQGPAQPEPAPAGGPSLGSRERRQVAAPRLRRELGRILVSRLPAAA